MEGGRVLLDIQGKVLNKTENIFLTAGYEKLFFEKNVSLLKYFF